MKPAIPIPGLTTLTLALTLAQPTLTKAASNNLHLIHAYPSTTALENLAIRSNGHLLLTSTTGPNLYSVDPCTGTSSVIAQFPNPYNHTGALGITETSPDIFYAVVGTNALFQDTKLVPVSWALYRIDFTASTSKTTGHPAVTHHQALPGTAAPNLLGTGFLNLPNGLTTLEPADRGILLVADFFNGTVYRADTQRRTLDVALRDPALANPAGGANGVKVRHGEMYVSNYMGEYFVRARIDTEGKASGNVSTLRTGYTVDDFAFDNGRGGAIYGAANEDGSVVLFEGEDLSRKTVVAANITGPSAVQFGRTARDSRCLYVTAEGALYGVDVDGMGACAMPDR